MGIISDLKAQGANYRLTEEALYAEVLREIESGVRRDGLWAKALSEVEFDEPKAKAHYMKLRVQALRDEFLVARTAIEQHVEAERRQREQLETLRAKEAAAAAMSAREAAKHTEYESASRQRRLKWGMRPKREQLALRLKSIIAGLITLTIALGAFYSPLRSA